MRNAIEVEPLAGALGAEIAGVDLSATLTDEDMTAIRAAFARYQVLFFPNQRLTPAAHRDFATRFGDLDIPRFVPPFDTPAVAGHPEIYQLIKEADNESVNIGGFWHADVTHRIRPNMASFAYVREAPACGGDTLFANLYLAYETLSSGMRAMLQRMRAVHSSAMPYGGGNVRSMAVSHDHAPLGTTNFQIEQVDGTPSCTEHPVIRRHPDTGRKCLYVNRGFTSHFAGMTMAESRPLLEFLWRHIERPEFTCRYRWQTNVLGMWDNRCVVHYALNDYYGQRRVLHRIAVNEAHRPD